MAFPDISSLGTPPSRLNTPTEFSNNANNFLGALPTFRDELNAFGDYAESFGVTMEGYKNDTVLAKDEALQAQVDAELASQTALASANFKGEWSGLTGALNIPASVSHNGIVWHLTVNLPNITLSEPSGSNTDWIAVTQGETTNDHFEVDFELKGDSCEIGMVLGFYSNGKAKVIKDHPGISQFSANNVSYKEVIVLSSTKAIVCYVDVTDGNKGKAIVANIEGHKMVSYGAVFTFNTLGTSYLSACLIDSSNVLVCYQDIGNSYAGTAKVLTVSIDTVSSGTATVFNAATTSHIDVCLLTSTKALVAYRDEGNTNQGTVNSLTISGNALTAGIEVSFESGATSLNAICRLTNTKAVVSYKDEGNSNYGTACIINVPAGINVGTPFVYKSSAISYTDITRLSDTTCICVYSNTDAQTRLLTASDTTLTAGTEITFNYGTTTYLSIDTISATKAIITFIHGNATNKAYYGYIENTSGTTLVSSNNNFIYSGTNATYVKNMKIFEDRMLTCFTQNSKGYLYCLDLSSESLRSIAGIALTGGKEFDTITVNTQGLVNIFTSLSIGSNYFTSSTGFPSTSSGKYKIGVCKTSTSIMLADGLSIFHSGTNKAFFDYIDELYTTKHSPSYIKALSFDFWKTRTIQTASSGTFTVPAGIYYLMIACGGGGGNGGFQTASSVVAASGGGGGGLAIKFMKVVPGQQISWNIDTTNKISYCEGMVANKGQNGTSSDSYNSNYTLQGGIGGTAFGGDYNFNGGNGGYVTQQDNYPSHLVLGGGGGLGGGLGGYATISGTYIGYCYASGGAGRVLFEHGIAGNGGYAIASTQSAGSCSASAGGASPLVSGASSSTYQTQNYSAGASGLGTAGSSSTSGGQDGLGINPYILSNLSFCILPDIITPDYIGTPPSNQLLAFGQAYSALVPTFGGNGSSCGFGSSASVKLNNNSGVTAGGSAQKDGGSYGGGGGGNNNTSQKVGGSACVMFVY